MKHFVSIALIGLILTCNCNADISEMVPQLGGHYNLTGVVLDSLGTALQNGLNIVQTSLNGVLNLLDDTQGYEIEEVKSSLNLLLQKVSGTIRIVFIELLELGQNLLNLDIGPNFLQDAKNLIVDSVERVSEIFKELLKESETLIKNILDNLKTLIGSASSDVGAALEITVKKVYVLEMGMNEEISAASDAISKVWNEFWSVIGDAAV